MTVQCPTVSAAISLGRPAAFESERVSLIRDVVERQLVDRAAWRRVHVLFAVDTCSHVSTIATGYDSGGCRPR